MAPHIILKILFFHSSLTLPFISDKKLILFFSHIHKGKKKKRYKSLPKMPLVQKTNHPRYVKLRTQNKRNHIPGEPGIKNKKKQSKVYGPKQDI